MNLMYLYPLISKTVFLNNKFILIIYFILNEKILSIFVIYEIDISIIRIEF